MLLKSDEVADERNLNDGWTLRIFRDGESFLLFHFPDLRKNFHSTRNGIMVIHSMIWREEDQYPDSIILPIAVLLRVFLHTTG